jgi:DNA invertase Pin-like site-specific DNA recombinase
VDTTTAGGKLIFHIFGALAEFERALIRERTMAGLQAARARGKKSGRKPMDPKQIKAAVELYRSGRQSAQEVCEALGIGRSTLFKYLREEQ